MAALVLGLLVAAATGAFNNQKSGFQNLATSLVLLTATAMGLASCPVSEMLEIRETRDAIRGDAFGDDDFPQMLLRVGWAPVNADPLPSTPRRSLDDIVVRLDGSRFD